MRLTLLQFDDFAPDALTVREKVLEREFTTETGPDQLPYTGILQYAVPQWHALIEQHLHHKVDMKMAFFRQNRAGETPHSFVHSDEMCGAKFAGLLYLNLPHQCMGGTAFWRHTALNVEELPSREALYEKGLVAEWYYQMMNREWKDLTWWEQCGFVAMRFNRFVTYPTSRFHSRYPFEGYGDSNESARLVWTCFYDLL